MMNRVTCLVASLFSLSAACVFADDQPLYNPETGTLTIPSAAVQGQPGRFQDVVLEPAGNGLWRVAQLHDGVLLDEQYVEEVWTTSTSGLPRQFFIHVAGTFPNGCPAVGRVEQQRTGNVLQVHIYYAGNDWLRDPESVVCTQALKPFELTIPLDIHGLPAGEYAVHINNQTFRTIVLPHDNLGPGRLGAERRAHCQYEPGQQNGWSAYSCTNDSSITLQ